MAQTASPFLDPNSAAPAAGPPLLEVQHATVVFGKFTAVNDVSFSLRSGDLLGLIGPNGAGKTTLLRTIASLQMMTAGTLRLMGEPIRAGDDRAARMVGFTPDVPPVYELLTVAQFLKFIANGYGMPADQAAAVIDFWLEKVWLKDKKSQRVRTLSRGMKQRLGIARTLLPNPQVILLDEPAAGLDPAGRVQFRKLLADLRDQGKTLIISSHILSDMEEYCTHIAIMSHASLMKFGTVREISAGVDDGRCRYAIELAEPMTNAEEVLATIPGVVMVRAERVDISLEYWSSKQLAAELLRELVSKGVPVAGFTMSSAGLEEAYLRAGIRQVD